MFGLADIGYPELGSWSLNELRSIRLPFGMGIERDLLFTGDFPISVWAAPPAKPAAFAMPSACFIARAACQVGHDPTRSLRVPEGFCSFGAALFAGRGRRFFS